MKSAHVRQAIEDFSKTAVASALATAVDGAVFLVLIRVSLEWGRWSTGYFAATGAVVGGLTHYLLCRFWVFTRFDPRTSTSLPLYFFMSGSAALLHGAMTQVSASIIDPRIGWMISKLCIYMIWIYPMSRFVVFGRPELGGSEGHVT